jgi:predicted lipoprotein with Yx(FWY)xxD motif
MSGIRSSVRSVAGWVGALTAAAVLLAGCGSTSPTARSTPTPTGSDAAASARAQVSTTSGSLGVFLVDGQNRTLYAFDADPEGTSGCYDACATAWPPLATTGDPNAAGDASDKKLSTSTRTDGITQVLYGGHPLYTFSQDAAPGQATGQGLTQQGGMWWVVGVDGTPIKTPAAASATASS